MEYSFNFEKLVAYQHAKGFAVFVYQLTKMFPDNEKFGLISQLRRASVSVMSNIVEGNARMTNKDKARFFSISYSSLMEIISQLELSFELEYITKEQKEIARQKAYKLAKIISGLRKNFVKNNP